MFRTLLSVSVLSLLSVAGFRAGAQVVTANPPSLSFFHTIGPGIPPAQTVQVNLPQVTATSVSFNTTTGGGWLVVTPSGAQPATGGYQLAVVAVPSSLVAGTYTGSITVTVTGVGGIAPLVIPVSFTLSNQPLLMASPLSFDFFFALGGTPPASQGLNLNTTGGVPVPFTAAGTTQSGGNWLGLTPASGTTPSLVTITANPAGLPVGTYTGTVVISSAGVGNSPVSIPITLRIVDQIQLMASPQTMQFEFQLGGPNPVDQILTATTTNISLTVGTTVTTAAGGNWLTVTPGSGNSPLNMTVSVNPASLAAGTYNGTIRLTAPGASNSPQDVPVTLRVSSDPILRALPSRLTFTHQIGTQRPARKLVVVSNIGANVPATVVTSGGTWLTATPATGSTPLAVIVNVDPTGLAPGTYNGSVAITGSGAATPLVVPVTLYVANNALLRLSADALTFEATVGAANPGGLVVNVGTTAGSVNYTAVASTTGGGSWLGVTPNSGPAPADISVTVNTVGLTAGTYQGTVTVSSPETGIPGIEIPVRLVVSTTPLIAVQSQPLVFTFGQGSQTPANQQLTVNSTGGAFNFTASPVTSTGGAWLVIGPTSGVTGTAITVGVNALLPQGVYTGLIEITAAGIGNSPRQVPVILDVTASAELNVTPAPLTFDFAVGGAAPPAQTLNVSSVGQLVNFGVAFQTLNGGSWLTVSPLGGLTPSQLTVTVNPAGLPPGTYSGTVSITSAQASNSPRIVPVTLTVRQTLPTISLNGNTLAFPFTPGGAAPAAQQLVVSSSGAAVPVTATPATASGGNWLAVTSSSPNTPATLSITVNPAGLAAGTYMGTVTVASAGASGGPLVINVTLTVSAAAVPQITSFEHGASFAPTSAVPGLIFTIKGTNLGPTAEATLRLNQAGNVDSTLSEVRVLFDGIPGPLLFVSATQVNGVIPYGIAGRATVRIQLEYRGVASNILELRVGDANPGIFRIGQTQGAILNTNGTVNGAGNRADRGSTIVIYATGEGATSPSGVDGSIPNVNAPLKRPVLSVRVVVGGREARVDYAGSAPGFVSGVLQINVTLDPQTPVGAAIEVQVIIGGVSSSGFATVAVQ